MTTEDIAAVLDKEPLLNDFGIGLFNNGRGLSPEERDAEFEKDRRSLLSNVAECNVVCQWLRDREKIKTVNRKHSSYGYKHMVENATKCYVSNGAFIAAAIHCGFPYQLEYDSPNVCFGIAERSLKGQSTLG